MSQPPANPFDSVARGERAWRELHVGELPSGTPIRIRAHVAKAAAAGPTVLLLGGVHGDEVNGIEIVRQLICGRVLDELLAGTVVAIPLLNVYGFLNYARDVPDGKDVNRSFPGSMHGSLAARVAYVLRHDVIPLIDFGVDFHTGGNAVYNYPQVRYAAEDPQARVLAKAFAAPVSLASAMIDKSLRQSAHLIGKSILVFEGGENMRLNPEAIDEAKQGVRRLLIAVGMLSPEPAEASDAFETQWFDRHRWLRAERAGLFDYTVASGGAVAAGELLGYLRDPYGRWEKEVLSPRAGLVIGQDNSPVVNQGDALIHLAWHSEDSDEATTFEG